MKHHDVKRVIGRGRVVRPRYWLSRNWVQHTVVAKRGYILLAAKKWWGVSGWACYKGSEVIPLWPDCDCYKEMEAMKRRPPKAEAVNVLHLAAVESNILAKCHPIVAHCCHTQYDDGAPRKPGWVTIKTMGSAWVVEVKDPDSCSRLTVVQQTLDDAITLASMLLESEEAPWEPDPWLRSSEAKKKNK